MAGCPETRVFCCLHHLDHRRTARRIVDRTHLAQLLHDPGQAIEHVRDMAREKAWKRGELREAALKAIPGLAPSRYDREMPNAFRECDDLAEATAHLGKTPVHLVGLPQAVEEMKLRLEREYAESQQKEMDIA